MGREMAYSGGPLERRGLGITLPELLVVVAIIGLALTVAVPLIQDAVRSARVRAATDEFVINLMAARMLAVTRQTDIDVVVSPHPDDFYEYPGRDGRLRRFTLPEGIRIVSSTSPISFRANGMVDGGATTRFEARVDTRTVEQWEIRTSLLGIATVTRRSEP